MLNFARWISTAVVLFSAVASGATAADAPRISPLDAYEQQKAQTAELVDVREHDELAQSGMAAGALWFPTSKITDDSADWRQFVSALPKEKLIIVYCRSGHRAGLAATRLLGEGFRAANMGAFDGWKKAGLPVVYP
jgi:carboxyl-terminal processing protease